MSKFGIKIKNLQAASIYEYKYGFRDRLDSTKAMLVNSLFLDFLLENNLIRLWKGESTRDVICVEFGYGTRSHKEMVDKISAIIDNSTSNDTKKHLNEILNNINNNKLYCKKISKNNLRTIFYRDGFEVCYKTRNKKGEVISKETIKYKMLYRTPGKAKKGTCMFINEDIYEAAHNFLYMGIHLPDKKAPIVEMGAYSSLITSSIVGKVKIEPEQILVVDDVDSFYNTTALLVDTDDNKHCYIKKENDYQVVNTMFDGQSLIDSSIFPEWADGYVLLRHHMTKTAAFNTNIQLFMQDHFGDQYETAYIKDRFGRDIRVKDIRLITTENSLKWLKFKVSFDYWADWVKKNGSLFGIVKTTHESKLGDVQRMSYQMMNALDIATMPSVCSVTTKYIEDLKTKNDVFMDYLEKNQTFSNDFEVLIALIKHNPDFVNSSYFRERRKKIISTYLLNFKSGHGIQNADNLTIVGSPYALLLQSVGEDPFSDPTFEQEINCTQCWTDRFSDGEYLAEFRSPFNARNNLGYLHNHYHPYFCKYFNFGKLVIAVNMRETDFQPKNNGSDQDSDSLYVTNQKDIVNHAKKCCEEYPVIVNCIQPEANIYDNTMEDFARVDNSLAAAQMAIGESSNLAQIALTYTYNFDDQKYQDYVCILSVLAQIAIDNAKRKFDIDLPDEIARIKSDLDIKRNGLPKFWQITKRDKRKVRTEKQRQERDRKNKKKIKDKINAELICPMNYIYEINARKYRSSEKTIGMDKFWIKHELKDDRRKCKKVEKLIEGFSLELYKFYTLEDEPSKEDYLLLLDDFENLIDEIKSLYISKNYLGLMSWLINRAFYIGSGAKRTKDDMNSNLHKNKSILLKVLYTINPEVFLQCFKKNVQ